MNTTAQIPDWAGVAASVVLVLLAASLALYQRLGVARDLVWAAARAFVQLLAVGALLTLLFAHAGLWGSAAWVVGMVVLAGFVAAGRAQGLPAARVSAWIAVGLGTVLTLGILLALHVVKAEPIVVVPVGGMVVSAAMSATALTMRAIAKTAVEQRPAIEARLSLGMTGAAAFAPYLREGVRTALIPAIDTTKVVGLIALPGAMTGLILAGVSPFDAIRYQIVVMYMLLAAATLSSVIVARLATSSLFDSADRLVRFDHEG
ncbi:MAG: iron export ABC transporter permease subunit FetB [Actinobacteria bacterium]|nr:iron export ABC transporter permease subunit FetB [Actinomycetota bacterium]